MKILVCIKQILAPELAELSGRPEIKDRDKDPFLPMIPSPDDNCYRLNPFDEYAVEEALRIRDSFTDVTVDALSLGPMRCRRVLLRALEMGVNNATLLRLDRPPFSLTPFETASILAAYLRDKIYDLILTGVMAEDGMNGQTGQLVAALLDMPCATAVISERLLSPHGPIYVEREEDGGERATYEICLPAVLTIQSGINRPRYPALSHVLRARTQEIVTLEAAPLLPTPRERIVNVSRTESSTTCTFIAGSLAEKAGQFLDFCRQKGFLGP
ncbi:MAG: electron transfer flavoprotein subunit beta/FixA family protein [Syntrophales bacterium]|nr:electron transfer flavoprotein subunit beta/FixA family protein [Syntrophales bacterium]MCK9391204.1 electron transfer flavoprotein subunit beta/FixA family protein [Syntrophales bacterium]